MFKDILKNCARIEKIISDKKMYHHLVLLTNKEAVNAYKDSLTEKEFNELKKVINEDIEKIKTLTSSKGFLKEWNKLSQKNKLDLILVDKSVYKCIRKEVKREDLCFTKIIDYTLDDKTPKDFFDFIGVSLESFPGDISELELFKEELKNIFPNEMNEIGKWTFQNYKYNFRNCLERNIEKIGTYNLEKIMIDNNQISGYALFLVKFQNELEKKLVNI